MLNKPRKYFELTDNSNYPSSIYSTFTVISLTREDILFPVKRFTQVNKTVI